MVKRLLIDDNPLAFRLSKAGVDVEASPNYDDLLFDIALGRMSGIWMKGSFLRTQMTLLSSGTNFGGAFFNYRFTVNFGKTFSVIPQMFVWCRDPRFANDGHLMPNYEVMIYDGNTSSNTGTRSSGMSWQAYNNVGYVDLSYINVNYTLPSIFYYVVLRI